MNLADQSMGELARTLPGATAIFHDYHLDFCCGGDQTVRQAAEARGLDVETVVLRLERLRREDGPVAGPDETDLRGLVRDIHARHQLILEAELPELIRLAGKVERVHARHPRCPVGLGLLLKVMELELGEHVRKERPLFTALTANAGESAAVSFSSLRDEHEQLGERIRAMEVLTDDMVPPERACRTWQALYTGLDRLRRDLVDNVHLESNVLFVRAGTLMDAARY